MDGLAGPFGYTWAEGEGRTADAAGDGSLAFAEEHATAASAITSPSDDRRVRLSLPIGAPSLSRPEPQV
jgi:hypothetical protein